MYSASTRVYTLDIPGYSIGMYPGIHSGCIRVSTYPGITNVTKFDTRVRQSTYLTKRTLETAKRDSVHPRTTTTKQTITMPNRPEALPPPPASLPLPGQRYNETSPECPPEVAQPPVHPSPWSSTPEGSKARDLSRAPCWLPRPPCLHRPARRDPLAPSPPRRRLLRLQLPRLPPHALWQQPLGSCGW